MGRVQESIAAALAANLDARVAWDEPAELYWVRLSGGEVMLRQLPTEEGFFDDGNPADILSGAAQLFLHERDRLEQAAPAGMHGLAFYCEEWSVSYPQDAPDGQSASEARRLDTHPHRVEQRGLNAVDRAGIRYRAVLPFGGEIATQIRYPGRSGDLTGTVYEALDSMMTTVLGVELPR